MFCDGREILAALASCGVPVRGFWEQSTVKMKIVIAEKISRRGVEVLKAETKWRVVEAEPGREKLLAELADAEALVIRSGVQADADLLEHAPRLQVIGRAGIGVDNVDIEAATKKGVLVMKRMALSSLNRNRTSFNVTTGSVRLGLPAVVARWITPLKSTYPTLGVTVVPTRTVSGALGLARNGRHVANKPANAVLKAVSSWQYRLPVRWIGV